MTRRLTVLSTSLGVWALVLAAPSAAQASTILFTNYGGGFSYNTTDGNPLGNDFVGDNVAQGDSFKPLVTDSVDLVRISLSDFVPNSSNVAPITVELTADAGGLPGAVLESWTIAPGTLGSLGVNNPPVALTSLLHPTLSTANTYWLTASTTVDDSIAWNLNSTGDVHHTASSYDAGATWFSSAATDLTPGAFDVEGPSSTAPVPEPGTLMLLASGLALAGRRWRTFRTRP
jgi:PEP-CTERM motif